VPPADDSFYTPPSGWESSSPGTILASRPVPNPIAAVFLKENVGGAYQLLYRTTDSLGNPSHTVTSVLIPHNADYTKIVQYHIAEDASYSECAPSYAIQYLSDPTEAISQIEMAAITAVLNTGVVVTVPDYEGPNNAFGAGIIAGQAALDSVRAVLQSNSVTRVSSDAKVTLMGYSGGSIPVGHAAQVESTYAPDLKDAILGYSLGGVVANLTATGEYINGGVFSGFIPDIMVGLSGEYPQLVPFIQEQVSAEWYATIEKYKTQCIAADLLTAPFINIYDIAADGEGIFTNSVVGPIMDSLVMASNPATVPVKPIYMYHSENDEIVPFGPVSTLYKTWCSQGAVVSFHEDLLSEHATELVFGLPGAVKWQYDILNGDAPPTTCSVTQSINNAFNLADIEFIGTSVAALLLDILADWPVGSVTI
jgi:Secretory lipase